MPANDRSDYQYKKVYAQQFTSSFDKLLPASRAKKNNK